MPRMIAADLYPGRRVLLDAVPYRIARLVDHGGTVILVLLDGTHRLSRISRSSLLARLCDQSASLETWSTGAAPP